MSTSASTDAVCPDALWSFLWGKRRSRRHAVSLAARLAGPTGDATGEAVDLSRHGALVRAPVDDLGALAEGGQVGLLGAAQVLGDGFELTLGGDLHVRTRLVRLCWRPGDEGHVYLGCEFAAALGADRLVALGLSPREFPAETGVGTPPAADMPFVAREDDPLTAVVFDVPKMPLYTGPLMGVRGEALALHLVPADPTAVVARLSGKPHSVSVVLPGAHAWTAQAYLLAVRLLDGRTDAVEVVLAAARPPPRAVLRHLRRRRGRRSG